MPGDQNISYSLICAVREGRLERVRELISSFGLSYSQAWEEGYALLRESVENRYTEVAKLLLTNGSKVNSKRNLPIDTPLHFAVRNGDIEIVKMLLDRGADIDAINWSNITSLQIAVESKKVEILELLLKYGAGVNVGKSNIRTPLLIAAKEGSEENVRLLLKHGADVNSSSLEGYTPLCLAVNKGHEKVVQLLLEFGANVNAEDKDGKNVLHFAVEKGDEKVVKLLLEYGANVGAQDKYVKTVLHFAVEKGDEKFVKLLLESGANIEAQHKDGKTVLHFAVDKGDEKFVKLMLECGANVDGQDKGGKAVLNFGVEKGGRKIEPVLDGHLEVVDTPSKLVAGINSEGECGSTPLHIAAEKGHLHVVEVLLKFGASVDSKDKDGRTPLHIACDKLHKQIVIALLDHGADINVVSTDNETPLDFVNAIIHKFDPSVRICGFRMVNFIFPARRIAFILKCHMVRMKTANLFVSKKNLLSISNNDELSDLQNKCEEEVSSMKNEKFGNANVSFYDILTKEICQLAMYARNECIVQILRSDDYKMKFPIYASMINCNIRKGERRNELLEQGHKIFHSFFNNFSRLPHDCTAEILSYLSDKDLRNLIDVCKPVSVSSPKY